jgi:hypothetical protein
MPDDVVQIQRSESRVAEAAKMLAEKDAAEAAATPPPAEAAPAAAPADAKPDPPPPPDSPPAAPAAVAAEPAEEQMYTERMAEIARRQRELDMRTHQLKNYERELASLKTLQERVKADPIATLRDLGVDFFKLVEDNIGSGIVERPAESKPDPRLDELHKTVDELKKALQRENVSKQEAIAKDGIRQMVSANPDRLKLIDKYGDEAVELVFSRALHEWNSTGEWNPASAALEVEQAFREQAKRDLERIKASGLFDDMFAGTQPKAATPKPAPVPETKMGSELTRESPAPAPKRRLTAAERLAEAARFANEHGLEI